jgi:hypothetical protein
MNDVFNNISPMVKGNLFIFAGIILLLNTLGFVMRAIYILMLTGSILMILYGIVRADYYHKIMELIRRRKNMDITK